MNESTIRSRWNELKGRAKERWGRLTNEELYRIEGRDDELVRVIQRRYGKARDTVRRDAAQRDEQGDMR